MKTILVCMVMVSMSSVLVFQSLEAATVGTFSEGIRVGVLYKCSIKAKKLGLQKSTECELQLGKASSGGTIIRDGKDVRINPWAFSADAKQFEQLMEYVGKAVYVRYRQVRTKVASAYWTDYIMQEIGPLDPALPKQEALGDEKMRADFAIRRSSGIRVGRIVKASNKGGIAKSLFGLKSNEIIIQLGGEGSHFIAMSITDAELFAYALEWAKSGKLAKVHYDDNATSPFSTRETQYVIWRISRGDAVGWPNDAGAR